MLFSTTTFLLLTCISSAFTAPLHEENDVSLNLNRRAATKKPPPPPSTTPKPSTSTSSPNKTPKSSTSTSTSTSNGTPVPSATSSASNPANSCVLPTTTPKRFALRDLLRVRVDVQEFIGWHGTNANTAALWASEGEVVKPVKDDGSVAGKSVLDAELGPGLYLTDTLGIAETAAVMNSKANSKPNNPVAAKVCAIYAKSSQYWRQNVFKVRIPEVLRGNGEACEQTRAAYIPTVVKAQSLGCQPLFTKAQVEGVIENMVARIGPLVHGNTQNQMLIPEPLNPRLTATCFDVDSTGNIQNRDPAIPQINYFSNDLKNQWKIIVEDDKIVTASQAATCKRVQMRNVLLGI